MHPDIPGSCGILRGGRLPFFFKSWECGKKGLILEARPFAFTTMAAPWNFQGGNFGGRKAQRYNHQQANPLLMSRSAKKTPADSWMAGPG